MKKFWAATKRAAVVLFCIVVVALLLKTHFTNVRQDKAAAEMWSRLDDRSATIIKDKEHMASLERRIDNLERKLNDAGIRLTQ